tara:strand:+ start:71 stop:2047 length:1977 start_codon:yes stop_codon:yes gene_type:complete
MAEKIEVEFELKYKDALKSIDKLQKELKDVQKDVKDSNEATEKQLKDVEKSAEGSAKGVTKVGASLKNIASAVGIVAILQKAFEFVSSAIQENQEVMNALNTVFETAQIVFNQIVNVFTDVYKAVSSSSENFDALGKVIKGLLTISITPLKLAFDGIKLALLAAQLAWEEGMFGDGDPETVKRLNESILETKQSLAETANEAISAGKSVVTNFAEAVTEVGAIGEQVVEGMKKVSISNALETAKANMQLKKNAEIAEASSRILLEQYDREAEKLRQIRDDTRVSVDERIAANNELKLVLEKQQEEMTANANAMLAAAEAQFKLTGKNEDYVAVLSAEAEVAGVLATATGFLSEQRVNEAGLQQELIDLDNAQMESASLLSIEQKRFNAEKIEDNLARLTKMQEIDALEAEQETLRLQAIVDNANAGTQAKIDAQIALDQFTETSRQTNLTRDQEIAEEELVIEAAKTASKQKALDDLISIGGAETKFGKAMLIAKQLLLAKELIMDIKSTLMTAKTSATKTVVKASEAGVDVSAGAAKAASALPFPANIPLIIGYAAQAFGIISSIKSAMSASKKATSKVGAGGGGSVPLAAPSAGGASTAMPSLPPEFNTVGASDTNQLADAIGGQSQQPIQTYVVSNDVTSAQSLERNIVTGATID